MSHCFIVPAYIYNNILEKGSEEQQTQARDVLGFMAQIGSMRTNAASLVAQLFGSEAKSSGLNREVYDAQNKTTRPGKLVRAEGDKSNKDIGIDEAYDGSGHTYNFFKDIFGRDSIDGKGMKLVSTCHYSKNYGNAFWDGQQMTYGDGDGRIFNRFTCAIDVIGHEIAHGVTERTAGLEYYSQSGALNEHFSDVFGSCIKQRSLGQTAEQADWLIGQGLFTEMIDGVALRSMKEPGSAYDDEKIGRDPQPNHMDRYIETDQDQGGVHLNSSIPNKAFYETAIALGGYSWDRAAKIWYSTLTTKLGKNSQFNDFAKAVVATAGEMYGDKSIEKKAVIEGLKKVGLPHGKR